MARSLQVTEEWKPVPGYEGRYEVSDLGRVRSLQHCWGPRPTPHLLKPGIASTGYPTVALGRGNTKQVHALVLSAFVGPCPPGQECRHKNGVRSDPRLVNLEYGTRAQNIQDAIVHGTWHSPKRLALWARHAEAMQGNWKGVRRATT